MAKVIHLVSPLANFFSGSARRARDYLAILSPHAKVTLWSERRPHVQSASLAPRIDPVSGKFPRNGVLVLVGIYVERSDWLAHATPDRLIIVYNTPELHRLHRLLDFVERSRLPEPELIFPSETLRASSRITGFVDWGRYDFESFKPSTREPSAGQFTVGRMSRDEPYKHHQQDPRLYRHLVEQGMRVRLMGATTIRERIGDCPTIEVLGTGSVEAPQFLQSLDAFVYRTATDWREPSGRVVVEAMACGLPVVVGRNGGYCELIQHGENGFLFDTHAEAIEYLNALRSDRSLAQRVGHAARSTVVDRFGDSHIARVREFFLQHTNRL